MKYLLTEAGQSYWERMDALRKKNAPTPKAKAKLHITPENMARFLGAPSPAPKLVQKEFKFEEKKTLLQRVSAWVQPSGPRVKVPREMTTDQRERAYKRFKRTALGESSRGVNRIVRRVKAGHLDPNAPTVTQKGKDQLKRYKETEAGGDPNDREKNVRGTLASVDRGIEDTTRVPNVFRSKHEFNKKSLEARKAEKEYAASTRAPHVVRSVRRALSRGIGAYVPGRDQTGTVTTLAQQRKESPTVNQDIADKAKAYRKIRAKKVPPSMN